MKIYEFLGDICGIEGWSKGSNIVLGYPNDLYLMDGQHKQTSQY